MSTGPAHYRAAEKWLTESAAQYDQMPNPDDAAMLAAIIGQGFATLAHAAAVAELNACEGPAGSDTVGRSVEAATEWAAAFGRTEV